MGQATIDRPDPLNLPPVDHQPAIPISAAALASADDLLSQLAGDDIDRLLAEAENADHPQTIVAPHPDATPSVDAIPQLVEPTIEAQFQLTAETPTLPSAVEGENIALIEVSSLQIMIDPPSDAIEMTKAEEPSTLAPTDSTTTTIGSLSDPLPASAELSIEPPTPEERRALVDAEIAPARSPSVLVRLLQIVNSPMAWLPDAVRDALGKVALLTIINALAVLGYVLLFRAKHPH